jgi:hypothetical protein
MKRVQGLDGRSAPCDDRNLTQEIAYKAVKDGLQVAVKGRELIYV